MLARSYEFLGRPSGIALDADYAVGYGYDKFGRVATVAVSNGVQFDYSYVPNSPLLAGWSVSNGAATAYAYEPNRNLTQLGPWTYAWDAENRLISVSSNGVPVVQNPYDYLSRWVMKATATQTNRGPQSLAAVWLFGCSLEH